MDSELPGSVMNLDSNLVLIILVIVNLTVKNKLSWNQPVSIISSYIHACLLAYCFADAFICLFVCAQQAETHQATVNIVELGRTGKTQATGCLPVVPSLQQNEQPGPVAAGKTSARYRTAHQSN